MRKKMSRVKHGRDIGFELIYTGRDVERVKDKTILVLKRLEDAKKAAMVLKSKVTDPKERELANYLYTTVEKWLQKWKAMNEELHKKLPYGADFGEHLD